MAMLTGGGSASATQGSLTFSLGSKISSFPVRVPGCSVIIGGEERLLAEGSKVTNKAEEKRTNLIAGCGQQID